MNLLLGTEKTCVGRLGLLVRVVDVEVEVRLVLVDVAVTRSVGQEYRAPPTHVERAGAQQKSPPHVVAAHMKRFSSGHRMRPPCVAQQP